MSLISLAINPTFVSALNSTVISYFKDNSNNILQAYAPT
jgi:hypothetical protein